MPKTRSQKKAIVKDLSQKLGKMNAAVFATYKGIKVLETEDLRKKLYDAGAEYQVVKNSLLKLALKDTHSSLPFEDFSGQVSVVMGFTDEIAPARILAQFAKEHSQIQILSGMLGKELIDKDKVMELAMLPTKEQLLARLLGSINAPVSNFVGVLRAEVSSVVHVLSAISKKKEEGQPAAAPASAEAPAPTAA